MQINLGENMRIFKMFKKYPVSNYYFVAEADGESTIILVDGDLNAYDIINRKKTSYFTFYKKSVKEYSTLSNTYLTISQVKKETIEGFKKFKEFVQLEEETRNPKNLKTKVEHKSDKTSKYDENTIFLKDEDYDIN